MGCNTSQESVPNVKAEKDERYEEHARKKEDNKPESARTITLTSNGTAALSGVDGTREDRRKSHGKVSRDEKEGSGELEEAATKIQAVFRGHQTRKSMKQPSKHEEVQPTQEELEEEFRTDDTELCHAATKIQASFRGHMIRKQMEKKEDDKSPTSERKNQDEEELDIDLSDPDLNKAAVKIQASFRGHMVRKENENEPSTEN